jgi:hypothetical protein|tara:strand:- start:105 stop:482 length:378 start_codon:yes stop_codon:yes gene_type:complete
MSHFAEVDKDGIVRRVIVIEQDMLNSGNWGDPNNWVQTSYNTRGGIHYAPNSHEPDGGVALRKNYAGKGYTYDQTRDAFIPPKPFPSWILNEDTCNWDALVPYPDDGKRYTWNEPTMSWVEVEVD